MATPPRVTTQLWHLQVRDARKRQRMSQREMARRTGIHQTQLSRIENGVVDPRVSDAIRMSRVVGFEFALVPRRALPIVYGLLRDNAELDPPPSAVELLVGRGDDA